LLTLLQVPIGHDRESWFRNATGLRSNSVVSKPDVTTTSPYRSTDWLVIVNRADRFAASHVEGA
jgi:hypothetical protein